LRDGWQIDFSPRLIELLSHDPSPHRTRRIRRRGTELFEIGCGAWRAVFSVADKQVMVGAFEPGFPLRFLTDPARTDLPDRLAQLAFLERWPESGGATPH